MSGSHDNLDPNTITLTRHCLKTLMHKSDYGAELVSLIVTLQVS